MQPRILQPSSQPILQVHVNERGDLLTIVHGVHDSRPGPVRVVRLVDGETVAVFEGSEKRIVSEVAFSDDGERVAYATGPSAIGDQLEVWSTRLARRVAASPTGKLDGV